MHDILRAGKLRSWLQICAVQEGFAYVYSLMCEINKCDHHEWQVEV